MNILQINTSDTKGGAAKVAYRLKSQLSQRGHQVSYLVSKKYSKDTDVKLIRQYSNLRQRILKKLTYYLANDLNLFRSDRILKMPEFRKADIVHCHNLHTNYFNISTLQKISAVKPVVWTLHDMWPITAHCAHAFDGKLKDNGFFTCPSLDIYPPIAWHNERYLERKKTKTYKESNFNIVVPSQWLANKVSQSILKDKPINVIYNGVDTSVFKPHNSIQVRQELDLPQNKKIILVVSKRSQSNPWKGRTHTEDVLAALGDRKDIFIVDLGGDENSNSNNKKNVSFILDENLLAKYYSAADVLLYPSIADNCPLVVLEAQACGLPVVAFKTGGIPELVAHQKTGWIAEYKETLGLIRGSNWILNLYPTEKQKMSRDLAQRVQHKFNLEVMVNKYLEIYKQQIDSLS